MRHFFISLAYTGWEWNWQISSHHVSLRPKNENFFNWDEILLLGRDQNIFLSKKKNIGTEVRRFLIPLTYTGRDYD